MKKTIILLSALCVMLTSAAFATEDKNALQPEFGVIRNGQVIKVLYKNAKFSDVRVSIFDQNFRRVFSEVLKGTNGFGRPYDLSKLPKGVYVVELSNGTGVTSKAVVIEDDKKTSKSFKVARVFKKDGKVLVTVGRHAKRFQMKIVDDEGKVLYSEEKSIRNDFAKVYDVSSIDGTVTFHIKDEHGNVETVSF